MSTSTLQFAVVILGSGPAGTATALELIKHGVHPQSICLIDRSEFPRQKLCGGGLTGRANRFLSEHGIRLAFTESFARIRFREQQDYTDLLEPSGIKTCDRWELDQAMLLKARSLGVVHYNADASVQRFGDQWQLDFEYDHCQMRLFPRFLVIADGFGSKIARTFRQEDYAASRSSDWAGKLFEFVVSTKQCRSEDLETLEMCFDVVKHGVQGYTWFFPFRDARTGEKAVKIGIMDRSASVPTQSLKQHLLDYAAEKQVQVDSRIGGYPERYWKPFARMNDASTILIGDALGVEALLGEGLAISFDQAQFWAPRIARSVKTGRALSPWTRLRFLWSVQGWNHWFLKKLGDFVYTGWSSYWLSILCKRRDLEKLSESRGFGGYGLFSYNTLGLIRVAYRGLIGQKQKLEHHE